MLYGNTWGFVLSALAWWGQPQTALSLWENSERRGPGPVGPPGTAGGQHRWVAPLCLAVQGLPLSRACSTSRSFSLAPFPGPEPEGLSREAPPLVGRLCLGVPRLCPPPAFQSGILLFLFLLARCWHGKPLCKCCWGSRLSLQHGEHRIASPPASL